MATNHPTPGYGALAARLTDHADSIVNVAAHQLEIDLREAAAVIREIGTSTPAVVKLIGELRKAALFTSDTETKTALRNMLGKYAAN
jgi:hypothetical protein